MAAREPRGRRARAAHPRMTFPHGLRALRHRDFRRFYGAQVVAQTGAWMQMVGAAGGVVGAGRGAAVGLVPASPTGPAPPAPKSYVVEMAARDDVANAVALN